MAVLLKTNALLCRITSECFINYTLFKNPKIILYIFRPYLKTACKKLIIISCQSMPEQIAFKKNQINGEIPCFVYTGIFQFSGEFPQPGWPHKV
jgi:hypothetical protein